MKFKMLDRSDKSIRDFVFRVEKDGSAYFIKWGHFRIPTGSPSPLVRVINGFYKVKDDSVADIKTRNRIIIKRGPDSAPMRNTVMLAYELVLESSFRGSPITSTGTKEVYYDFKRKEGNRRGYYSLYGIIIIHSGDTVTLNDSVMGTLEVSNVHGDLKIRRV